MKRSQWFYRLIQVLVSGLLLAWVLSQLAWEDFVDAFTGLPPFIVAIICTLYYVNIVISCWKWQILLRLENIQLPLPSLVRWYLIGSFASNFLPTDIGGDLGRGLLAGRASGQPLATARSILGERFSGLVVMMVLAWLGLILLSRIAAVTILLLIFTLIVALGAIILSSFRFNIMTLQPIAYIVQKLPTKLRDVLSRSVIAWRGYLSYRRSMALVLLLSIVFQFVAGVGYWLNMRAVGMNLPLPAVILAAAVVGVAGVIPITVNGWGLRESILIMLLVPLGASPVGIVASGLLGRAIQMVLTLPGAAMMLGELHHGQQKKSHETRGMKE